MAKRNSGVTPQILLRFSLGAFFILLGIMGVVPNLDESVFSLQNSYTGLEVLFGAVELVCGIFLIASMFAMFSRKIKHRVSAVILVFWLARILISRLVFGFVVNNSGVFFRPSFSVWLLVLACELVIASSLWANVRAYAD